MGDFQGHPFRGNQHGTSIDQGILSPSGRVSGRTREAALERTRVELFGKEGLQRAPVAQPSEVERAARELKQLRDLKERGMTVPGYKKRVKELERLAGNWTPAADATRGGQRG